MGSSKNTRKRSVKSTRSAKGNKKTTKQPSFLREEIAILISFAVCAFVLWTPAIFLATLIPSRADETIPPA